MVVMKINLLSFSCYKDVNTSIQSFINQEIKYDGTIRDVVKLVESSEL